MKILIAVDGSGCALEAVKFVLTHAHWYREGPAIELVYVHLPVPQLPRMNWVVSKEQIQTYYEEEGTAALASARQALDGAAIPYTSHILVGPIAESIVEHAVKTGCDLIAIGGRGMGAAANLVLGSITTKVVHVATLPVLIVK